MDENELIEVQNRIDYKFKNLDLLIQAFVRSSYAIENGGADNEVLEFIGDRVLDLIIVQLLVDKYGYIEDESNEFFSDLDEGELTEIKRQLVQRKNLARRIDMLGFADYLIMGNSDIKNNVDRQESVKEDLFEAIIGAVALDCEWNMKTLKNVIEIMLEPYDILDDYSDENYISLVQEWCMIKEGELPLYHVEEASITKCCGNKYIVRPEYFFRSMGNYKYMSYLKLPSIDRIFVEFGMSEKESRMKAAETAYQFLEKNDMLLSIRDEIENPSRKYSINQLETLARRGYFSMPIYNFKQKYDRDGNPIWSCKCCIKEYDNSFCERASTKRDAKKAAAYKMLLYVLNE